MALLGELWTEQPILTLVLVRSLPFSSSMGHNGRPRLASPTLRVVCRISIQVGMQRSTRPPPTLSSCIEVRP